MKKFIFLLSYISFVLQAQNDSERTIMPPIDFVNSSDQEHFQLLIRGMNQWAFNLYKYLSQQSGNFCASPFSIAATLTMAGNGAKQVTSTEIQQLLQYPVALNLLVGDLNLLLLKIPSTPKNAAQLLSANAIWIQKEIPLLVSFQKVTQRDFQINVGIVNFEKEVTKTIRLINEWGAKQTKGKINQLIFPQDVNYKTNLILTSCVYLQGQLQNPFDKTLTKRDLFFNTSDKTSIVSFMLQTNKWLYKKEEKWECITLPYVVGEQTGQFMTTFLIPKTPEDLKNLESVLLEEQWLKWQKEMHPTSITLSIPRFRIDSRFNLNRMLIEMGLKTAFTTQANFSGISTDKKLYVNLATHRAVYRLNETGSSMANSIYNSVEKQQVVENIKPQKLQINRPFVFIVWEARSRAIIFVGRIMQP